MKQDKWSNLDCSTQGFSSHYTAQEGKSWTVVLFSHLTCFLSSGTSRENAYQDCSVCKQTSPVAAPQFSVLERHRKRKSYLVQGAGMLFYNFVCLFLSVTPIRKMAQTAAVKCPGHTESSRLAFFSGKWLSQRGQDLESASFPETHPEGILPCPLWNSLKNPAEVQCWSCHLTHLNAKVNPHGLGLRNGGGRGSVFVPFFILLMFCIKQGLCILFWLSQNSSSFEKCEIVWGNVVEQVRAANQQ